MMRYAVQMHGQRCACLLRHMSCQPQPPVMVGQVTEVNQNSGDVMCTHESLFSGPSVITNQAHSIHAP